MTYKTSTPTAEEANEVVGSLLDMAERGREIAIRDKIERYPLAAKIDGFMKMPRIENVEEANDALRIEEILAAEMRALKLEQELSDMIGMLQERILRDLAEIELTGKEFDRKASKEIRKETRNIIAFFLDKTKAERKGFVSVIGSLAKTPFAELRSQLRRSRDEALVESLTATQKEVYEDYLGGGPVSLSRAFKAKSTDSEFTKKAKKAFTESTRDKLLASGAIGVGNCIYVSPESASNEEKIKAIRIRLQSIKADARNVLAIADKTDLGAAETLLIEELGRVRAMMEGAGHEND